MKADRRLVTILFADIVGYTAMMQEDEKSAFAKLAMYQKTLGDSVLEHQGEIIKNFGDGSLCIFSSVLQALLCAKQIQEQFGYGVKVPLRIGLHLGDVTFAQGDIYGDAINKASRIESMGIPGNVLMSKEVFGRIANQKDLSFQNLGSFEFKNIDEPIEVFALSNPGLPVPKKSQLKGKFKEKDARKVWLKRMGVLGSLLIISALFWLLLNPSFSSDREGLALDENRLAIFPFQIQGPDEIQYLSQGVADLIGTSIGDLPDITSVDPNILVTSIKGEKELLSDPAKAGQLTLKLGAGSFILGTVLDLGDKLVFSASKYLADGKLIGKVKVETDNVRELSKSVDRLTREIVARDLKNKGFEFKSLAALTTSDFNSLKAFLLGEQESRNGNFSEAMQWYLEAVDLDSTFAQAWIRMENTAEWLNVGNTAIDRSEMRIIFKNMPLNCPENGRK